MYRIILSLLVLNMIFIQACNNDDPSDPNENNAPIANFTVNPTVGDLTTVFQFDASNSSDAEDAAEVLQVRWDWENDGTWDTEYNTQKTANHQYTTENTFTIKMEVKDSQGAVASTTKEVTVEAAAGFAVVTGSASDITSIAAMFVGSITGEAGGTITDHGHVWSYLPDPDTDDNKTSLGSFSGTGEFTSNLSGLVENIEFYVRAYAIVDGEVNYGSEVSFTTIASGNGDACPGTPTVTDADGNEYNTVLIDGECWMKENLNVGARIDFTQSQTDNSTTEKYCYNDDPEFCKVMGGLYQWDEMMNYSTGNLTQGICPDGWRIPTFEEVGELLSFSQTGNKLMALGSGSDANNETGFSALMAGKGNKFVGNFEEIDNTVNFWSTKTYDLNTEMALTLSLVNDGSQGIGTQPKITGYSIRCIKDE